MPAPSNPLFGNKIVWDMEAEFRYWCQVAQQKQCDPVQFEIRWEAMQEIYRLAADPRCAMEDAFTAFLEVATRLQLCDQVSRLVFGYVWARIMYLTRVR